MKKMILKALSGPIEGRRFPITETVLLGRSKGDILLEDGATSNPHAEIKVHEGGVVMIVDKASKNGIYVNGVKKIKSILEEGSVFQIGNIKFEVQSIDDPKDTWFQNLIKASKDIENQPQHLESFHKEVYLHFLEGPQEGKVELLTYGPRSFGSELVEGALFDEQAQGTTFTLSPKDEDVIFQTPCPQTVFLNNKSQAEAKIKNGDLISVGWTTIKVQLGDF